MSKIALLLFFLVIPAPVAARQANYAGSFATPGQNGTVTVTLRPTGNGQYSGTMANGTLTWRMRGEADEDALTGTIETGQGVLAFEAHITGDRLQLILVEVGADGIPRLDQGQELVFARVQSSEAATRPAFPGFSASTPTDPFVGSFTDGQLTLSLQKNGDGYAGRLALGAEAHPVTAIRKGDRLEGTMKAPTGDYGIIVNVSNDGVVLSNAGTEYAMRRIAPANTTAGTTQAGTPSPAQGTPQTDNSPLAQQWRALLAGKKVTYISSYSSNTAGGGGLSTKLVYHLCSNGQFGASGSDVVSVNIPGTGVNGGGSAGSNTGTWRIVTEGQVAGIELRYGNGRTELYRLDMNNGQTFANGERVYVTPGEACS